MEEELRDKLKQSKNIFGCKTTYNILTTYLERYSQLVNNRMKWYSNLFVNSATALSLFSGYNTIVVLSVLNLKLKNPKLLSSTGEVKFGKSNYTFNFV